MKKTVTIIDYGMSNTLSISRAFEFLGVKVILTDSPAEIIKASRLVLPGVGAFSEGMAELNKRNIVLAIKEFVASQKPFLGVCLGMQMMLDKSSENGNSNGLGLIQGSVLPLPKLQVDGKLNKIPHVSWNQINLIKKNSGEWKKSILNDINSGSYVYFVHSFYASPVNAANILAITSFNGFDFPSAIKKENAYGVQFHPEKSGEAGLKILENFLV